MDKNNVHFSEGNSLCPKKYVKNKHFSSLLGQSQKCFYFSKTSHNFFPFFRVFESYDFSHRLLQFVKGTEGYDYYNNFDSNKSDCFLNLYCYIMVYITTLRIIYKH